MYLLPNVKNNNFKKKRQGSEKIQTMDSSIERNFWTEAWYLSLIRQCVVKHRDSHEERTFEWTRWRKETWMLYNEARILVRIYLIIVYFHAIIRNKVTPSNQIKNPSSYVTMATSRQLWTKFCSIKNLFRIKLPQLIKMYLSTDVSRAISS